MRTILRGLAVLALGTMSVAAYGQETVQWYGISCAHSKLNVPASLHCRTTQNYAGGHSGWAAGAGGTFRRWMASGEAGGVRYYYHLTEATSLGAYVGSGTTLQDGIRSELERGKEATSFSALANRNGVDYMTFTSGSGDSCVAIRRYGPSAGREYQWILNAVRCEPRGRPTTESEIDRFIAGATVRGS